MRFLHDIYFPKVSKRIALVTQMHFLFTLSTSPFAVTTAAVDGCVCCTHYPPEGDCAMFCGNGYRQNPSAL